MFEQFEKSAIRKFAERVAVPLFEVQGTLRSVDSFQDIGTGTLFSHGPRLFLVTSDHVLDGTAIDKLVVPDRHDGRADLVTLGRVRLTRPVDSFLDVAILEICDDAAKKKLRERWTVISKEMTTECPRQGAFLLLGYPSELRNPKPLIADVERPSFALLTDRILQTPKDAIDNEDREPIFDDVDLFFEHRRKGRDDDGSVKDLPGLKGMSGCTVWSYRPGVSNKLWTPETHLRAVGIQSGVIEGSYIRAKYWRWAVDAIEHAMTETSD